MVTGIEMVPFYGVRCECHHTSHHIIRLIFYTIMLNVVSIKNDYP